MAEKFVYLIGVAVGVVALLILILVPSSFSYLEYHEFGFVKRKTTGEVSLDKVYGSGRYAIGPDHMFKTFTSSAHVVYMDNIDVFASDKLEVTMSATFQYFLREEDLADLHKAYDIYYAPIMKTSAVDALKGASTIHSTRDFIRNRKEIEADLFKAVRERLGGKCCEKDCGTPGNPSCYSGCKAYSTCTKSDKGLFASVRYFQLGQVKIPMDVEGRFLQALILNEQTEREHFLQEATVVRKETEGLVKDIINEAHEISQNATAQANLILSQANATATQTLENAQMTGLRTLFNGLGISMTDNHKMSFNYLRNLKDLSNLHMAVDFNSLMVGPLKSP
ncbi:unnamed protein product [Owenia fusiformis]|uniref:Band 7 domain-containing protein n=1 Tax=Owenia fusiformis TaxID=6347 RepID=A0A8J1UIF9_OWEFU|nr:unnamed protein product [Owenia fusiformis]